MLRLWWPGVGSNRRPPSWRFGTRIRQRSRPPFTVGLLPRGRVIPHIAGTERALVADAMPGALAHPLRQAGCRVTDGPGDGFVDGAYFADDETGPRRSSESGRSAYRRRSS